MLEAAKHYGINICCKNHEKCIIEFEDKLFHYEIIALYNGKKNKRVFAVSRDETILCVLGSAKCISSLFSNDTLLKIENLINDYHTEGLRPFVLASKRFNLREGNEFKEKLFNIHSFSSRKSKKIKNLFKEFEENLEYIGIIGMKSIVSEKNLSTVNYLLSNNYGLYVFSSEGRNEAFDLSSTLNFQNIVELLGWDDENECYKNLRKELINVVYGGSGKRDSMRMETLKDLEYTISTKKVTFSESEKIIANHKLFRKINISNDNEFLKKPLDEISEYSILLDRLTLITCLKSEETKRLLICALSAAKQSLIYGLMPADKVKIINMLKTNINHKPRILAIGHNHWSLGMIQIADIGISPCNIGSDINLIEFSELPVLLSQGFENYRISVTSIFLQFFKNAVLCLVLFGYQFWSQFSALNIIQEKYMGLFNLITSIPLLSRKYSNPSISQYLIISILLASLILLTIILGSQYAILLAGHTEDFASIGSVIYIVLVSCIILQIFYENRSLITLAFSIGILIVIVSIIDGTEIIKSSFYILCLTIGIPTCSISGLLMLFICIRKNLKAGKIFPYKNLFSVYKSTSNFDIEENSFSSYKYSLRFKIKNVEKDYKKKYIENNIYIYRWTTGLLFILDLIWSIVNAFIDKSIDSSITRFIVAFCIFIVFFIMFLDYFKRNYILFTLFATAIIIIILFTISIRVNIPSILGIVLIPAATFILVNVD